MQRTIFDSSHTEFRSFVRDFVAREIVPAYPSWEAQGQIPRDFYAKLGHHGLIGMALPAEHGGGGERSYRYGAILTEEVARAVVSTGPLRCHMDVVLPYFLAYASPAQRARWFPGIASGEHFTAIAMTEPGAGTDLAGLRTHAEFHDGQFVLNGSKTFITGGLTADLIIVVARTEVDSTDPRHGLSLLVVEEGMPGFEKGRNLDKLGLKVSDTAELFFTDVEVPISNVLGHPGRAYEYLGHNLPMERLGIAVTSTANTAAALAETTCYTEERVVRGQRVLDFQNTRFELASVATELEAAQFMVDRGIEALDQGELTAVDAAKIKLFCSEMCGRSMDRCLQLFGGYGYMSEYPISRLFADARVNRIYGGTSEVMRAIIGSDIARSAAKAAAR